MQILNSNYTQSSVENKIYLYIGMKFLKDIQLLQDIRENIMISLTVFIFIHSITTQNQFQILIGYFN